MPAPLKSLALAAGLSLALTPSGVRASGVSRAPLAGTTVITWSGVKGLALDTEQNALMLPPDRVRVKTTGDFALVVVAPRKGWAPADCPFAQAHCDAMSFLYLRPIHQAGDHPESFGHDPPILQTDGGPVDVYLMSDGEATVTLEVDGVSGNADYRAAGAVAGRFHKLAAKCPTDGCDTSTGYASRYAFGGENFDLGSLGYAGIATYSATAPDQAVAIGSHQARTCMYPNPDAPAASAELADHPWGCDLAGDGSDPETTGTSAKQTARQLSGAGPSAWTLLWDPFTGMRGLNYLGFHAGAIEPTASSFGAYAMWFRYGIDTG